jgi:Fe-S oxidoreductase
VEEALATNPKAIVANCPFCITMLQDGVTAKERTDDVKVYDLSEMILNNIVRS